MARHIQDRWYKTEIGPDDKPVKVKSNRCGTGMRYRAGSSTDGSEKSKSFPTSKKHHRTEKWLSAIETDMTRGQYATPSPFGSRSGSTPRSRWTSKTSSPIARKELGRRLRLRLPGAWLSADRDLPGPEHVRELLAVLEAEARRGIFLHPEYLATFSRSCPPLLTTRCCRATRVVHGASSSPKTDAHPVVHGVPPRCSPFERPFWSEVYQAMVDVGAGCGLRQGEVFGLADVIDADGHTLHVVRQIKRVEGHPVFALPKGGRAGRAAAEHHSGGRPPGPHRRLQVRGDHVAVGRARGAEGHGSADLHS